MPVSLPLLEFWYAGLRAKVGVRVRTQTGTNRLRSELYKVRKENADPQLWDLAVCISRTDPTNELWIVHKKITVNIPDEDLDDAKS